MKDVKLLNARFIILEQQLEMGYCVREIISRIIADNCNDSCVDIFHKLYNTLPKGKERFGYFILNRD